MTRETPATPVESLQQPEPLPDLAAYRAEVAELLIDLTPQRSADQVRQIESMIGARLDRPEVAAVLDHTPNGIDAVRVMLLQEIQDYVPNDRSSATDLNALLRIFLLSQIDALWWGDCSEFQIDGDVERSGDLVDLEPLRRRKLLKFDYRRQPKGWTGRVRDSATRRAFPNRRPNTAGVRFTRVRPEVVALVNDVAESFALLAPPKTPRLWVTSMTRSIEHQHRLRSLGYAAVIPSAHCAGYAIDIEMAWFERFDAAGALATVLLEQQHRGQINVIDEGQAWHVCISPDACAELQDSYSRLVGA